jgi:serine/threonine-protein kinase RsbW
MSEAADQSERSGVHVVELSVDALPDRVVVIRNLLESVLLIDDFGLDTVADVKLGIDEVCAQLVAIAPRGSRLRAVISTGAEYVRIEVCCEVRDGVRLDEAGFGWFVVGSVTDSADVTYANGESRVTLTALRN